MDALFDLGRKPPTTRTIALQVREHGTGSLDQAQLRADAARYQEVTCRSALNRVEGMPFNWTLNPYRGCTHGCHYCFARRYQTQFELGPDDEFSSLIFVKVNFAEVLRQELDKPSWTRDLVALGTATDPYQPIEGHYKLTRRSIEALIAARTPVGIVTKGPMVVRDRDLLAELSTVADCTVCLSVPTVDEDAWRALEPGTAHPLQRLRAVRTLREVGVNAGVLMAPRRARLHDADVAPGGHDQGRCRSRRGLLRRERDVLEGRNEGSLHGFPRARVSPHGDVVRAALRGRIRVGRLRPYRARAHRHAAGAVRDPPEEAQRRGTEGRNAAGTAGGVRMVITRSRPDSPGRCRRVRPRSPRARP